MDSLSAFFGGTKRYSHKRGEIILRPDDIPQGVYYIEKGFIKVYSVTENGDEKLHIIYKSGELFPLIWVFNAITKDVFYEAISEVHIRKASRDEFLEFIGTNNSASIELIRRILHILNVHVDRVDNLQFTKAYPRLVSRLLFLAKRFGKQWHTRKGFIIEAPLTHQDIADSINMTRETTSREFEKLEKRGLVSYSNRFIVISDLKKLEQELQEHFERKPL